MNPANDDKSLSASMSAVMENYIVLLYTVISGIEIMVPLLYPDELRKTAISLSAVCERIGNIGDKL